MIYHLSNTSTKQKYILNRYYKTNNNSNNILVSLVDPLQHSPEESILIMLLIFALQSLQVHSFTHFSGSFF